MYRLDRDGSAPRALIVEALDTVLVSSAVVMEMPMVYHVEAGFYDRVKNGDWVRVDTEKLTVELVEKEGGLVLRPGRWGTPKAVADGENLPERMVVFIGEDDVARFEQAFPQLPKVFEYWHTCAYEITPDVLF